jgi:hypothetical protein
MMTEGPGLSIFVVSFLIGCQSWATKGRTGRAWGLLTFAVLVILQVMVWRLLGFGSQQHTWEPGDPEPFLTEEGFSRIVAIAIGGPLMAFIVSRLPKIHGPEQ